MPTGAIDDEQEDSVMVTTGLTRVAGVDVILDMTSSAAAASRSTRNEHSARLLNET